MRVFKNIDDLPPFTRSVLTIGTFDGVHLGHLQIIRQLISEAEAIDGTAVLITFYPHPKMVVPLAKKPLHVLNSPEEKYELLQQAGITNIVVVPFTLEFASQPALSYIHDFLVKKFNPHTIIIGYDHRFGKNREGDYQLLEQEALSSGFEVKEIPEHVLENITISSTRIREALLAGEIETANQFLGYPYFFSGIVVEGRRLGRTIGFPTANLQLEDEQKLVPANGVYAVRLQVKGSDVILQGMMNIGNRPTLGNGDRSIEVHIFRFDEDLYGRTLKVSMIKKLRDEVKFSGLEALQQQLSLDQAAALAALHGNG